MAVGLRGVGLVGGDAAEGGEPLWSGDQLEVAVAEASEELVLLRAIGSGGLDDPEIEEAVEVEVDPGGAADGGRLVGLPDGVCAGGEPEGAAAVAEHLGGLAAGGGGALVDAGEEVEVAVVVHISEGEDLCGAANVAVGSAAAVHDAGVEGHIFEVCGAIVAEEPEGALTADVVVVDESSAAADDEVGIAVTVDVDGGEADAFDAGGEEVGALAEGGEAGLPGRSRLADFGRAAAAAGGIAAEVTASGNIGWSGGAAARGGTGREEEEATDQPSWQPRTRPIWGSSGQCFLALWWG